MDLVMIRPHPAPYGAHRRSRSWGPSAFAALLLHAVLLFALATTAVRVVQTPRIVVTLLHSQSAAPPPPAAVVAAPPAAAAPVIEARPIEVAKVAVVKTPVVRRAAKASVGKPALAVAPPVPEPASGAPIGSGEVAGEARGVEAGVAGGQQGGRVGGSGDRIWPAEQVASPPTVLSGPKPQYPPAARARGIEGLVVLETVIDRAGHVEADALHVVQSVPALDAAAMAAIRQWRFRPGRDSSGAAVRVALRVPVRFQLR